MHTDDPAGDILSRTLAGAGALARGFGLRIVTHLASLGLAAGVMISAAQSYVTNGKSAALFFCTYVGLVCLVPRNAGRRFDWLAPFCAGLATGVVWMLLGLPWQAIFYGCGVQTWLQRAIIRRGGMGWEWAALPWLAASGIGFFSVAGLNIEMGRLLLPFAALFVLCLGFNLLYARFLLDPALRRRALDSVKRLETLLAQGRLPAPLEDPTLGLCREASRFAQLWPTMGRGEAALVERLEQAAGQAALLGDRPDPKAWDRQAVRTLSALRELASDFRNLLAPHNLPPAAPSSDAAGTNPALRLPGHKEALNALLRKKSALPDDLGGPVDGIFRAGTGILECMRKDPARLAAGDRFLARYLAAANRIADQYLRLQKTGASPDALVPVRARSADIMAKLEQAFAGQQDRLLRDDIMDFTAELNVLDTLLKMEGR